MRKQFTQPPNKRLLHRRGIRTARNVSNPDYPEHIPEIVIVSSSSDEDDGPPQAKCKATGGSISKAAVPLFVSKEVEDRLLADDGGIVTVAVVKSTHPGRSKSPSLLTGQEISHLVTVQPIVEAAHPGPGSKEPNNGQKVIATYSPVAPRLESQPDEEVEPMISLESVDVDNNEYDGESIDPLADSVHVAVVETQSDVQGTGLSKPEASVTSGKACIPDAVASSSRRTAPTLIKPPLSDTWTDIEYSSDPELELKKFLEEFGKSTKVTPVELKTVAEKMWKAFEKINVKSLPADLQKTISDRIHELTLSLGSSKVWKVGHTLQEFLDSREANQLRNNEKLQKKQRKREAYIARLEQRLKKIKELIKKYDEEDVDWDPEGEVNSSYLKKDRLVKQFMKTYEVLCQVHKCDTWTGRPTQKKINTKKLTGYDEISEAVDSYLNSRGGLIIPDFPEILKIAKKTCKDHQMPLDDETIHEIAKTLFQFIVKTMKNRRLKDLEDVLPDNPRTIVDKAASDPVLEEKLKENEKKKRKEAEVLKEFTKRQMTLKEVPKDVPEDEDIEMSPEGTDEEESDNTEDDEEFKSCSDILEDEDGLTKEITLSSDSNSSDQVGDDSGSSHSNKAKQSNMSAGSGQ